MSTAIPASAVPLPESEVSLHRHPPARGSRDIAQPLARGLVSSCLAETKAHAVLASFDWGEHEHFRFVARPALDEPDRRQLRGCLEDLRVSRLLVSVDDMTTETRTAADSPDELDP